MLSPWLAVGGVAARLRWSGTVTGVDLIRAGTEGGAEEIRDTAVAQPLLVATALAVAEELDLSAVALVGGHSVGELAAAALAGALSPEGALAFVAARSRAMARAAALAPTGMAALLGVSDELAGPVDEALRRLGLTAANVNGAGQLVAAGPCEALDALAGELPPRVRLRRLSVAGAFHTEAMAPARAELAESCAGLPFADPKLRVVSNADGCIVASGAELRRRLIAQVSEPVRWDACMATMVELGVRAVVELPPGGTLTGLLRRSHPEVETVAVRTPEDLPAARALLAAYEPASGEPAPPWRVVVAPRGGTFRPDPLPEGARVPAGAAVGRVEGRDEVVVLAPHPGVLVEWLASDGDPVGPGQPLVRLHPEPVAR